MKKILPHFTSNASLTLVVRLCSEPGFRVIGNIYGPLKAHGKEVIKKIKKSKPFARYEFSANPEEVQKIRYELWEVTPFFTNLHTLLIFKDPM